MQDLEARTLCRRVGTTFSSTDDVDILAFTFECQQRYGRICTLMQIYTRETHSFTVRVHPPNWFSRQKVNVTASVLRGAFTAFATLLYDPIDRFRGFLDKGRRGQLLLTDEIALGFEMPAKPSSHEEDIYRGESTHDSGDLAPSSITELSDEGTLILA